MSERPQPTEDLAQVKTQLDTCGYGLLANALDAEDLSKIKTRLKEQALAEKQRGLAFEDGGAKQNWGDFRNKNGQVRAEAFTQSAGGINQRVWMLINKGRVFQDMLLHSGVRNIIDHALGNDYLLSSHSANIAKPGGVPMRLHTDQWWMPMPTHADRTHLPAGSITREQTDETDTASIWPRVVINVVWMIGDFTAENGGTRIVPGSHLWGRRPDNPDDNAIETVALEGPAGTVGFLDGRIWHGTGANISDQLRWAILTTFCGPQFRPQENFTVGTVPEVLAEASPDLLSLLGFKVWNAYGRVESPAVEYIQPGEQSLGELRPNLTSGRNP